MAKGLNLEQNRMFWNKTEDGKKHSKVNSNWKQHFTTVRTKGTASVRGVLCLHLSFLYTASISEVQPASVPGWEKDICRVPRLLQRNVFFFLGRFITELKPVKARQHKMGQCSLTDTVCPPNVFSNSVEMFICHICQHLALALGAFFFCSWKQRCSSSRLCCHERHLTSLNYGKMESFYYAGAVQSKNC